MNAVRLLRFLQLPDGIVMFNGKTSEAVYIRYGLPDRNRQEISYCFRIRQESVVGSFSV